jgi:large subunit ribosomal protein L25
LRAEGKVPAVVYGHGTDPIPVSVGWRDLRAALTTDASLNALLDLQIDGESKLAIVKDLQRHPIRHTVSHVDFVLINRDEELTVEVPIVTQGEALEVTRENGIADLVAFTLTVKARPADIPNELVVDISELRLGDSNRVADIVLPAGVTTDTDPEDSIVVTSVTRAEAEAATDGEEGAEAEAVEGAAGSGESGEEAAEG